MSDFSLKAWAKDMSSEFDDFKDRYFEESKKINDRLDDIQLDSQRQGLGPSKNKTSEVWNKVVLPYLQSGDDKALKNMQVSSGPDGGYTVEPQLDKTFHEVAREISPVYNEAKKVICNTSEYEMLINADLGGTAWVGETESRSATTAPTVKKVTVPVHEQYSLVDVTQKLVDDSAFNIEGFVRSNVATAQATASGTAFITGDGLLKPMGILSYTPDVADDDSRDWEKIQYVKTGKAGDFKATGSGPGDVLYNCLYKLKAPYMANAVWLMSRSTAAAVMQLKDSNDQYYWQNSLQAGQPPQLIGHRVLLCEDMPAIASDSYSIALANLQVGYVIVERPGIRFLRDPYTNRPYLRLYFTRRVGGSVTDFNALKLIRFSA